MINHCDHFFKLPYVHVMIVIPGANEQILSMFAYLIFHESNFFTVNFTVKKLQCKGIKKHCMQKSSVPVFVFMQSGPSVLIG